MARMSAPAGRDDQEEILDSLTSPSVEQLRLWHEDSDSEPDAEDSIATGNTDVLEEEEMALISCYLNRPPALHVRR
jgi:hypothetical protein